ncbi:MAG: hypothetical protein LUF82_04950 [Clostridia bacterium]|nr:hypothetical protein [Clostridia bacterium]
MTQEELLNLFNFITTVECSDEQRRTMLEVAAKTLTVEKLDDLVNHSDDENKADEIEEIGVLKFTKQEISKMPKNFRKEFRTAGCTAHITKRRSGKDNWNYMIRYRKNGYNLLASSNSLEEAKRKFIEKLKEADAIKRTEDLGYMVVPIMPYTNQQAVGATAQPQVIGAYIVPQQTLATAAIQPQVAANPVQQAQPQEQPEKINGIPATFDKFSNYYFENFHIRKVCHETYRIALSNYKNHVFPHFGDVPISTITPAICQELLDKLIDEDKVRTEENVYTMLNAIFKAAVKHNIIQHNPMDMVFHTKHAREHGKALSKEEEKSCLPIRRVRLTS